MIAVNIMSGSNDETWGYAYIELKRAFPIGNICEGCIWTWAGGWAGASAGGWSGVWGGAGAGGSAGPFSKLRWFDLFGVKPSLILLKER